MVQSKSPLYPGLRCRRRNKGYCACSNRLAPPRLASHFGPANTVLRATSGVGVALGDILYRTEYVVVPTVAPVFPSAMVPLKQKHP